MALPGRKGGASRPGLILLAGKIVYLALRVTSVNSMGMRVAEGPWLTWSQPLEFLSENLPVRSNSV